MKRFFIILLIMGFGWQLCSASFSAPAFAASKIAGATVSEENTVKKTVIGPSKEKIELTFKKQFVYELVLFDGAQCQTTFCPEEIDTVYMVADVNNMLAVNKTYVYFWPITKEYMADWARSKEPQPGRLEIIKGNRVIQTLSLEQYALYYADGYPGNPTEIKVGREAEQTVAEYKARADLFYQSFKEYYEEYVKYQQTLRDFAKNPKAFGNKMPPEPKQPVPSRDYISDLNQGFIINLPAGTYRIRFRNSQNEIMSKSVKKLVVFPVLAKGVGYEIIPEDKWTYPTHSDDFSENLFTLKNQVLYLKPFTELQFNSFYYLKLTKLAMPSSGRGMENQKTWVHISPLANHNARIEIVKNNKVVSQIKEKPYLVKQRQGTAFGYDIVEITGNDSQGQPNFTAYRVAIPKDTGAYYLRFVDGDGTIIKTSIRNLRTVPQSTTASLILLSLLPLVPGLVIIGGRILKTKGSYRKLNSKE